jgi:hypothetical protein
MRRGLIIAIYALGGLGIALSLSFATFAVAGQDLNDPVYPVRPIAAPSAGGSASSNPDHGTTAHEDPTHSPRPGTLSPAPMGGSSGGGSSSNGSSSGGSSNTSTGSPEKPGYGSGSSSPSPPPGDNGGGGDDGGGGGGDD